MISTSTATGHQPFSSAPTIRYHLLTKPAVSGTPIRLKPPITNAPMVQGIARPTPAMRSSSAAPTRNDMQPSAMNSAPFIKAWLNRWLMPAVRPVTDTRLMPRIM